MTSAIVTTQGHDHAVRRKTCFSESTVSEGAIWGTRADEFALQRPSERTAKDPPSAARKLDVTDERCARHELRLAGAG
jgi:hypothetical protein